MQQNHFHCYRQFHDPWYGSLFGVFLTLSQSLCLSYKYSCYVDCEQELWTLRNETNYIGLFILNLFKTET